MRRRSRVIGTAAVLLVTALAAGCGGGDDEGAASPTPTDEVRRAATTYLQALRGREWERACGLMTADARRDVQDAVGGDCVDALSAGVALPAAELAAIARELPGARVRVRGDSATIGPLGALPLPLRLQRQDGRWLIAGV